jgi:hypothetical protein
MDAEHQRSLTEKTTWILVLETTGGEALEKGKIVFISTLAAFNPSSFLLSNSPDSKNPDSGTLSYALGCTKQKVHQEE